MSKNLSDLSTIHYGKSPNPIRTDESNIPILGTGGQTGWAKCPLFYGPAVVVGRKGTLGNPQYVDGPFWPIDTTYAVLPTAETNGKWLYYSLQGCDLERLNEATGVPSINRDYLARTPLQFSAPPQQRKIAKILTTVDSQIEKTEALIDKYQAVKQGMMHDLFTRGVDENGRLRPRHEDGGLGHWTVLPLSSVAEVGSGVTLGRKLNTSQSVSTPYLRVANVQEGYLDLSEIKYIDLLPSELGKYALKHGDLLLTEGGDFDKLGRGTLWREEIRNCIHQNHIFRVRVNHALISPEFLEAIIGSWYGRQYFLLSAKQTTNLASINSTQLKAFPVPCPSIEEQRRIVEALESISMALLDEQRHAAKLKQLKTALMQDLLTGKVQVTPDNEEAA